MEIDIDITGAEEVLGNLEALPIDMQRVHARRGVKAGAEVILGDVTYNCPHKSGALVSGLHVTVTQKGDATIGKVSNRRDDYYAIMQENGWTPRKGEKSWVGDIQRSLGMGEKGSFVEGKHFMLDGLQASASEAIDAMATEIETSMAGKK